MLKYISNITAHVELLSASILSASDDNMDVKTDTSKLLVDKSTAKTGSSGKESCYHTDSPLYEDISDDESFLELLDSSEQKNVSGNISGKQCERKTVACSGKKFEGGGGGGSDFGHSGFSAVRSVAKLENIVEKATPTPVKKSTENMSVQNCLPVKIEKPRTLKFPSANSVVSKNTPCDKDRSVPCDKVQAKRSTDEGCMPQVDRLLEPHESTDTTCSDAHSTSCNHNDGSFNSLKQLEEKCSVSHGKFNVASVDSDSCDGASGDVKGVAVHSKHCVDSEVLPNIREKVLQNVPSTLRIPRESDGGQELTVATSLSAMSDCKTQDKSKSDIASTVSDSLSMVDEQKLKLSDSTATPDSERPISDVDQKLLDKDLSGACGNKSPASVTRPAHIDDALRTAVNRDSFSCVPAETDCTPSLSEVQTRKRLSVLEDVSLEQKCRKMYSETVLNSDSVEKEVTSSELEEDSDICVLYVSKEKFQKVKSPESCLSGTNVSKDVSLKSLTVARGTSEVKVLDSCYQAIEGSEVEEIRDEINNSFNKKLKLSSSQGSACMENDSITNIIENKSNLAQEQLKSPAINTHILKAQGHTSLASTEVHTITKMPSVENGVVNRQILESSVDDVVHSVNTAVLDNPCAHTEEEVKPSSLTSVESAITSIVTLSKESVGVTSSGVENTNLEYEMALLDKNVNLAAVASPELKKFSVVACEKIGFSVSVLDREHEKGEVRKAVEIISEEKSNVRITANCEETRNEEPLILGMKSTAETTTEDAEEIKESLSPMEIVAAPKTPSVQQVPDVRVKDSAKELKISSPVYYSGVTGAATDVIPAKEMDSVTLLQSAEEKILGTLKTADLTTLATKPSSEETLEAVPSSADPYQALKSQSVEELLVADPAKDCVEPAGETEGTMHPSIENTLEATVLQLPENTIKPPVVEKTLEVVMPMKEVLKQPFTENTVDEVMSSLVQNSREVVVLPFAENTVEMLVSSAEKPVKAIVPFNAENTIEVTSTNNILETVSSPVGGISEEIIVPSGEEVLITSVQTIEAVMVPSAVETKEAKVLQSGVDFKEGLMLSTSLETKQAMVLSPTVESKEINATQPSKDSDGETILLSSEKSEETMNELGLSFTKTFPELVVPPCSKEQPVGKPKPPPSETIAIVLSGEETSDELITSDEFSAKVSSTSVGETFSKIVPISSEETYSKFETERALTPVATIDSVTELEPKILTPPTIGAENETETASLSAVESLTATEDFATAPVIFAEKGTKTELVSDMDKKTAMLTVPAKKGTAIASLLAVEKETTVTSVSSVENSTTGSIRAVEKDNATLLVPGVKKDMVMPMLDAEKETTTDSLSALKNKTVTDHFAPVAATEKDTAIEHVPDVEKETRTAPVFDEEMETSAARESAVEKKTAAEQHMAGVEKEFMTLTLPVDKKESATVTVPIKETDSATITVPVVEMETVTVTVPVVEEKTPTVTIPDVEEESATVTVANVEKYSETAPVLSVVMETTPACESAVEKNAAGLLAGNEKKSDTVTAPVVIKESATVTVPIVEKESVTVTVPVVEDESMTVTGPVSEKESVTVAALDNISKTAPVHSVDIETVPTCESTMEKKTAKGPLAGIEKKCVTVTAPIVEKESSPVTDPIVRKESATVTIAVVKNFSEIAPVLSVDMDLVPECESAVVEKIAEGHIVGMEKESGTVALPVVEKNSEISPVLSDDVEMAPACVPAVEKKTAAGPMAGMEKVTDTVTVPVVEKDLDPEGNVGKEVVSGVEKKIVSLTEKETGIVPVSTVEKEMALPLTPVVKYKTANSIEPNVEKDSINATVMQSEVIPALTSSFAEKVTANEIKLGTKSAEDSCDSKSPEGLTKGISVPHVLKHLDVSLQIDDHTTENVMAMFAGNTGTKTSATCVDEIAETHGLEKPLVTLSRDNLATVDEVSEESTSLGETPVLSAKPVITVLFPDDEPCEIASSPAFELVDAESLPGMDHVEASKKAAFASKANETEVSSSCVDSSEETCSVGAAGNVSAASCTLKEGLRQVPVSEICVSNSDQGCVSDTDQVTVSNVEQNLQSVKKINSDQFQNSVDLNKEVHGIMKKRKLSDTDLESDDSTQPRNKSATSAKCDALVETSLSHDSSVSPSLTFVNDKQSMETTDVLLSDKTKLFPETVNGRVSSCKTNSSSLTENIPTVTKLKIMQKKDKSKCLASQISLAQMLSDSGCSDNSDSSSSNLVPEVSDRTASESSDINSSSLALKRRLSNLDQGESKKVRVGRDKEQKISKESRHRANGSFPVTEEQSLLRDANMKASFSNKDLCSLPSKKPTTKIDFSIERVATKGAAEASDLLPEEKRELLSYVGQFDIENLQNLNARSFDKYVLLKTCQGFLHHSEFGVLRKECDKCCACCEDFEKKNLSLQKQVKDLLTVVQRLKTELLTKNPRTVTPIKIIRSVGLQVQIQSQPAQSHSTEVRQQSKFISKKRMREMESKGLRKKSIRILNSPRSSSFLTPASTGTLPQKPTPQPSPVKGVSVEKPLPSGFARKPQSADGSAPTPLGQRTQAHPQIRNPSVPNNARIMQSPAKPAEKQTTVQAPVSTPPQAQAPRGGSLLSKIVPSTPRTGSVIDLTDDEDKKASQSADQVSAPQVPTPVIRLVQPHQLTGPSPKNATAPQGVRPSAMSVQTRHSVPHSTAAAKNSAVGSAQQSGAGLAAASAVAAAAAAAGVGSSGVAHQPGGTVVTPPTQQTPQIRVANLKSMKPLYMDHPAPLPPTPIHQSISASRKLPPPKPNLKLSKVTNKDQQGIVLSWNMSLSAEHEQVASYQLYAYQEGKERPSTDLWKKVGDVKALPLPMACTLTQFMDGHKYYFAVRAVDIFTRTGQFSDPSGIVLNRK